jgi:hypothetical protein
MNVLPSGRHEAEAGEALARYAGWPLSAGVPLVP